MSRRRVVVTGLGCISPVGNTVAESWNNLLAGQSGIDLIKSFDASAFACKFAGEVKGFDITQDTQGKGARERDRCSPAGGAAPRAAVVDWGWPPGAACSEEKAV